MHKNKSSKREESKDASFWKSVDPVLVRKVAKLYEIDLTLWGYSLHDYLTSIGFTESELTAI